MPLRIRLVAAHRWSREAAGARADAARYAHWLVQLQRLDAPTVIVDAGDRAMNDAAEHARTSSTVAYALLGRDDLVAPEPDWPVPSSVPHEEGVALAVSIARHGCIEATVLAASARAAIRDAHEPKIAQALRSVALGADRRAAFAWRALSWLLETVVGSGSLAIVGPTLDAVYQEALAAISADALSERDETSANGLACTGLGQLAPKDRATVTAAILQRVVAPRFEAMAGRRA